MLDRVYLFLLVTLPLLIPALIVAGLFGSGPLGYKRFVSGLTLREDKGLSSQGLLWLSIFCPVAYFFVFGFISWKDHIVLLSHEGLNTLFSISAAPLGMLSLALPLAVLVSRIHSTKQTAEQIRIVRLKNNIDLFNSHRNDLFNYFKQIGEVNYLDCLTAKFVVHPRVHKCFFLGSPTDGIPKTNEEAFQDIERELNSARTLLDAVINNKNPKLTYDFYIANLCSTIYRLSTKLGLPEIYINLAEKSILVPINLKEEGKKELLTIGTTTKEAIAAYRYAKGFYQNLCDFSGREPTETVDESLKYIDNGSTFRKIGEDGVIERLHQTEIKRAIAKGENG